jgi:hypothetical protein
LKASILWLVSAVLLSGCTATYEHHELKSINTKLDGSLGVLISTPQDEWYESTKYKNSGQMTANAVHNAFARYTSIVHVTESCHGEECLTNIDTEKYRYYVKPEIFHWEERATEWSGKPDRIKIQISVFDAVTKEELSNGSFKGKSKWATLGGDHPQELLPDPTNKYVDNLYQ